VTAPGGAANVTGAPRARTDEIDRGGHPLFHDSRMETLARMADAQLTSKSAPTLALFIPELLVGGSEYQFLELARAMSRVGWRVLIVTYGRTSGPAIMRATEGLEVRIVPKGRSPISFLRRLRDTLIAENVDVLHACLNSAQAYAMLLRLSGWRGRLIFGVGDSLPIFYHKDVKNIVCDVLLYSGVFEPDYYVFNSHRAMGIKSARLSPSRLRVVYNLTDVTRFRPRPESRALLRRELGLPLDTEIAGMVANVSEYKDYPMAVRAAQRVHSVRPNAHFVAIGNTSNPLGEEVKRLAGALGLGEHFHFLGTRPDVEMLVPGFDILFSSSVTEGASNVICEAMACAVPCVVTDVGDSAHTVGDTGIVIPPRDDVRLAKALLDLFEAGPEQRTHIGQRARQRMAETFSMENAISDYIALYTGSKRA
jgi:glycosyltransferase involved in cell wall biosynthesis